MAMTKLEKQEIKLLIITCLKKKMKPYKQKNVMPFHAHLLGNDRMALFSFIQSLNTTFGTAIYEPVAARLARDNFKKVVCGKKFENVISGGALLAIGEIKNSLEKSKASKKEPNQKKRNQKEPNQKEPNQKEEVEKIRKVCQKGDPVEIQLRKADIYLVDKKDKHYPIDIKTVKPNIDGFEKYKENILKWTAAVLYENPKADVSAMLALPYNPNYPEKYKHFTKRKMFEDGTQLKVGEEFWEFLAGKDVYEDLLDCFKCAGIEMRKDINKYFQKFNNNN